MKNKPRRLWLNVKASGVKVPVKQFIRTLRESIENETYKLPKGWNVWIEWRNREGVKPKAGEWKEELEESAEESDGFNKAVLDWLERKEKAL